MELKKAYVLNCTLIFAGSPNVVGTISALVVCTILVNLKPLKNLKRQLIVDVFIKNSYPKINTF